MNWKDTTTYGRGQEKIPTAWSYKTNYIELHILKGHIYAPENWVMHCRELGINTMPLLPNAATKEEAQEKALSVVRERLEAMLESINQPTGAK